MTSDSDYYRVLGVLDDAEDIVIRAAYRALAQRYHPDRWKGDAAEANRRMAELNAAYAVLSDTTKRAAYDSQRDRNRFRNEGAQAGDANRTSETNRDWELAAKYNPGLTAIEDGLRRLSNELAFTFRLMLLESKNFDECHQIASELEQKYLRKFFGASSEVQAFAKELILEGKTDAARELNEVVRVLGSAGADAVSRIAAKFKTARFTGCGAVGTMYKGLFNSRCPSCREFIPVSTRGICPNCSHALAAGWYENP